VPTTLLPVTPTARRTTEQEIDQRPWGSYTVLDETAQSKVKRIEVLPAKRLSYQRHARRAEHWFIVKGDGLVVLEGRTIAVQPGDAIDVPQGAAHRIENAGNDPLVFIEVQVGDYFGEDDIERLEDDFGRAGTTEPYR
jgi:mannose-6-phosphate isomerase